METKQFLETLKGCKMSGKYTNQYLKIRGYSDTEIEIYENKEQKICSKCGTNLTLHPKSIKVTFNKPQAHLSVFQASLLFEMFVYQRKPLDYANYHKCKSGIEFIENIKEIKRE